MSTFEENILLWWSSPTIWLTIFLGLAFLSMIAHELGHAIAAVGVGAKVTDLKFGKPSLKTPFSLLGARLFVGLPFGGSCHYEWVKVDETTPWRSAFVRSGGWLADITLFVIVANIGFEEHSAVHMLYLYLWCKVLIGITPITSDGRKLLSDLRLGLQNP